jgi:DNA (cytosine-5)-methyltransferase 1
MKHGSLFSGIGGFDLAAEWMGWENVFHCEWNEFGKRVLNYYWPKAISYHDITKTDFTIHRGTIDILTGGFPCQPYSAAGKRLGKEDDRHLWPEMLRAIREIQPTWVVGENVRGLTNWNGGMVFDEVQADLEAEGYEVTPFLLPACAVNAPHRRDRIWFVAKDTKRNGLIQREFKQEGTEVREQRNACTGDSDGICLSERTTPDTSGNGLHDQSTSTHNRIRQNNQQSGSQRERTAEGFGDEWATTNTEGQRQSTQHENRTAIISAQDEQGLYGRSCNRFDQPAGWHNFPTQSPICNGDDGLSSRLDGITFPKWRNESIKGGGNAIVPQVAIQIFKAIQQYDQMVSSKTNQTYH